MSARVRWYGRIVTAALRARMHDVLQDVGEGMVTEITRSMTETATSGGVARGKRSPPSLPGHPPAVQTGELRGAITSDDSELATRDRVHVGVRANVAQYAKYLEFGTRYIAPRPFLGPALEAAIPELRARFAKCKL